MYRKCRSFFICCICLLSFCCLSMVACQQAESKPQSVVVKHQPMSVMAPKQVVLSQVAGSHLIIPVIHVNAPIENVDVTPQNQLGVPTVNQWVSVGWYDRGPRPGDVGSAVIDGHLDSPGYKPAVFWNLSRLVPGNKIQVVDTQGHQVTFQVTSLQSYSIYKAPYNLIFNNTSGSFLNLITCSGDWLFGANTYSKRLVVFTRRIS